MYLCGFQILSYLISKFCFFVVQVADRELSEAKLELTKSRTELSKCDEELSRLRAELERCTQENQKLAGM